MPSPIIHPTAIVGSEVNIAEGVEIGPNCILSGKVSLGKGVKLVANAHISGPATIGAGTILYPGACIGFPGQDFKFNIGDPTAGVVIGEDCIIREHVTVHAATKADIPTRIGNRVFMMVCSHVGHDGQVGNNVTMVNSSLVAGHAQVHDGAIMSGNTGLHQFCRMGRMAFMTGNCGTSMDIPPFCVVAYRNTLFTINMVGLRRSGVAREEVTAVRNAFWHVFRKNLIKSEMIRELEARGKDSKLVQEQAEFVASAKRPICRGRDSLKAVNDAEAFA